MKNKGLACILIAVALSLGGCCTPETGEKANGKLCTGTKRPYQVMGSWYTPQEHYDYQETGVASWYGPRFHGKPKSCGEIFNMHGISAAHKTLPIPSVVRVTNVDNGKNVKLLIDDRGPFVGDRIIDLSKGAASYLGLCNRGLGMVQVECLPEDSKAFADFVAQYGRYGRDPEGRPWETIFRENFDRDRPVPQPGKFTVAAFPVSSLPGRQKQAWGKSTPSRKAVYRRPVARPVPVSGRNLKGLQKKADQKADDESLFDTVAY